MHKNPYNDEPKLAKKSSKKEQEKKSKGVDRPSSCDIMEPTGLVTVTVPLESDM